MINNRRRLMMYMNDGVSESNIIFYTSTTGQAIVPTTISAIQGDSISLVSNIYENGIGKMVFSGPITKINDNAFKNHATLKSITFPDTLTYIGLYAFNTCTSLESITFTGSALRMSKNGAFDGCSKLTNIYARNIRDICLIDIESTGNWFTDLNNADVISHKTISRIYINNSPILYVTIPSNVEYIGRRVFCNCNSIESVNIHNGVTSIGAYAFAGTSISSLTIPASAIHIGRALIKTCFYLKSLVIDPLNPVYDSRDNCNGVIETARNMLTCGNNCTTIPNTVKILGRGAFNRISCSYKKIPNSVIQLGDTFNDVSDYYGKEDFAGLFYQYSGTRLDVDFGNTRTDIPKVLGGGKIVVENVYVIVPDTLAVSWKKLTGSFKNVLSYAERYNIRFSFDGEYCAILTDLPNPIIYYTLDGTTPTTSSILYEHGFRAVSGLVVKCIVKSGDYDYSSVTEYTISDITEARTIDPIIVLNDDNTISISCETDGSVIYYTTDNTDPTIESNIYTGSFPIIGKFIITAMATAPGYLNSRNISHSYYIEDGTITDTWWEHADDILEIPSNNTVIGNSSMNPYIITTPEQLACYAVNFYTKYYNKHIVLGADIDLTGHRWIPIGQRDKINLQGEMTRRAMSGTFNAKGYTISNMLVRWGDVYDELYNNTTTALFYGFFGQGIGNNVSQVVRNIIFDNCIIYTNTKDKTFIAKTEQYLGILSGGNPTGRNIIVKNSIITDNGYSTTFLGNLKVGGVSAKFENFASDITMSNILADVNIYVNENIQTTHTSNYVGGVTGKVGSTVPYFYNLYSIGYVWDVFPVTKKINVGPCVGQSGQEKTGYNGNQTWWFKNKMDLTTSNYSVTSTKNASNWYEQKSDVTAFLPEYVASCNNYIHNRHNGEFLWYLNNGSIELKQLVITKKKISSLSYQITTSYVNFRSNEEGVIYSITAGEEYASVDNTGLVTANTGVDHVSVTVRITSVLASDIWVSTTCTFTDGLLYELDDDTFNNSKVFNTGLTMFSSDFENWCMCISMPNRTDVANQTTHIIATNYRWNTTNNLTNGYESSGVFTLRYTNYSKLSSDPYQIRFYVTSIDNSKNAKCYYTFDGSTNEFINATSSQQKSIGNNKFAMKREGSSLYINNGKSGWVLVPITDGYNYHNEPTTIGGTLRTHLDNATNNQLRTGTHIICKIYENPNTDLTDFFNE